jgi:hypothetical protein
MQNISNSHGHPRSCPHCGSDEIVRSRRRGVDLLLSFANVYPYRCRHYNCERRFYGIGNDSDRDYGDSGFLTEVNIPSVTLKPKPQTER